MKFRKKSMVVDATQWRAHGDHPKVTIGPRGRESSDKGWLKNLDGGHVVSAGDWIIKDVRGKYSLCADDVFKATYEPVDVKKKTPKKLNSIPVPDVVSLLNKASVAIGKIRPTTIEDFIKLHSLLEEIQVAVNQLKQTAESCNAYLHS